MAGKNDKRASEDTLDMLHDITAMALVEQIRKYRAGEVLDEDGNALPVPPALLTAALKFLKDNGVDRPRAPGDTTDMLKDELPEFEGENVYQFPAVKK